MSEPRNAASQQFAERRRHLIENQELRGPAFGRAYAALLDEWLTALLGDVAGVALVACGGLGRREVAPESDLDVLLLHEPRVDATAVAARIWYPVWDERLALDHSVRTPKEAVKVAGEDLKTALTLLDGRVVAGDEELGNALVRAVREAWVRRASRRVPALDAISADRHKDEGDVAYLLEPDLKQAKGGLRDLAVIRAMRAAAEFGDEPSASMTRAFDDLFTARVELHRSTGRRSDRLLLEAQDDVASRMGAGDADDLMRRLAAAGRSIARAYDDTLRRATGRISGPKARTSGGGDRDLAVGIVMRDGEVDVAADAPPLDVTLMLQVAEQAARHDAPIALRTLRLLDAGVAVLDGPWPVAAREALVGLLGSGEPLITVFETLDEHDLLARILPEWANVRSRPQRNAFHRFTVDRHLTEGAVRASSLLRDVGRPDLLLVGAWLHDLGKGSPGDHTEAGVRLMRDVASRMGFDADDRDVLVALVEHHLLLPSIATSRDLDDPATIALVARAVRTSEVLFLLAALTKADSLATGPTAWSAWKEDLVTTLVARVDDHLAGNAARSPRAPAVTPDVQALVGRLDRGPVVERDGDVVTVVARDRPGLLCTVVGVLAVSGADVRSADASCTDDGVAVERVSTFPARPRVPVDWDALERNLAAADAGTLALDDAVSRRTRTYRRRPAAAYSPSPQVILHPADVATSALVVEVRAEDTPGLLYRVTRTIGDCALDIQRARVSTLGHQVVDTFYVQTLDGTRPDEATARALADALLAVLQAEPGQPATRGSPPT